MARRKNKAIHKPFESASTRGRFVKITHEMMKSKAWNNLTVRQRGLYLEIKHLYMPEHCTKGVIVEANDQHILFPKSAWKTLYGTSQRSWQTDIRALIANGFLDLKECGRSSRTPNIYAFSTKWQDIK